MDRKPLWSSWSSFSLSLTFTLSLRFNHPPPLFFPLFSSSASLCFLILGCQTARCCSTNFSHPFIPAIRPFPKSTLSQRGEAFSHWLLLHGNFSLFRSSFSFFCKSFFLSFHFIFVYPWLSFFSLTTSSFSVLFTLLLLFLVSYSFLPSYLLPILKFPGNMTSLMRCTQETSYGQFYSMCNILC